MALAGNAVVAIWNDITEEGRANFYEWHNREHMPERLGIPGFLRGRRYRSLDGAQGRLAAADCMYFTLYEVQDASVLSGAAYLERLNAPTPWTTRSVAHFRNVARSLCTTDITQGAASGGFLATLRFDVAASHDPALLDRFRVLFTTVAEALGIVAAHLCRADLAASSTKTAEQAGRPENALPRWVVMVEASTPAAAASARASIASSIDAACLAGTPLLGVMQGVYALQFDLLAATSR